ncbi:MAG: hypothetical protein LAO03_11530 [Acidobacteriia bacterium]|nr:hypothetical protein [Terriglobia bacterium]
MHKRVHIVPLSKLVHASPTKWEKLLREIEEGKLRAFKYYLPLREAIVQFCRKKGLDRNRIVTQMSSRARATSGKRGDKIARDNEEAFRVFEGSFFPEIQKFKHDFLRDEHVGVPFADAVVIFGHPHLEVLDSHGRDRFVVLHAADWKPEELRAYLDLLSEIVQMRFDKPPSSIWCMNLRTGKEEKVRPSSRLRHKCETAARLYSRFISAMESEA